MEVNMSNYKIILDFVNMVDCTEAEDIRDTINDMLTYMNDFTDDGVIDMDKINRHKRILMDMLAKFEEVKT
jgi:hypothetical protein